MCITFKLFSNCKAIRVGSIQFKGMGMNEGVRGSEAACESTKIEASS